MAAQERWTRVARRAVRAGAEPERVFALARAVVARWWEQAYGWERETIWPRRLHLVAGGPHLAGPGRDGRLNQPPLQVGQVQKPGDPPVQPPLPAVAQVQSDPTNLTRTFTTLLRKAGLRRIRFHDLRHSTATVYAHVRLRLQRDAIDTLSTALDGPANDESTRDDGGDPPLCGATVH